MGRPMSMWASVQECPPHEYAGTGVPVAGTPVCAGTPVSSHHAHVLVGTPESQLLELGLQPIVPRQPHRHLARRQLQLAQLVQRLRGRGSAPEAERSTARPP
jgi:hypothetical protein